MGEREHGRDGQPREYSSPVGEGGEHGVDVPISDWWAGIYDAERLPADIRIGGATRLLDQTLFVAKMSERRVLHINEILEDVVSPRGIDLPREVRAAQDVPTRAVDPVAGSETPRTKKSLSELLITPGLPPSRGCRWCRQRGLVRLPDEPLGFHLGRGVVREHFFVASRQASVVVIVVVDRLHPKHRSLLPRPKPQSRAANGDGAARGVDEDAHADGARGIQDILRPIDVHLVRQVQQFGVALVEADIRRGVKDGDVGGGGQRGRGRVVRPIIIITLAEVIDWTWISIMIGIGIRCCIGEWPGCIEGLPDLLSVGYIDEMKVDVLGQAGGQVGARGGSYIQHSNLFRAFSAFEQMADDPATKKACL